MAHLFDESEDEAMIGSTAQRMDELAAGDHLERFLRKVDNHLSIEKQLIKDWSLRE